MGDDLSFIGRVNKKGWDWVKYLKWNGDSCAPEKKPPQVCLEMVQIYNHRIQGKELASLNLNLLNQEETQIQGPQLNPQSSTLDTESLQRALNQAHQAHRSRPAMVDPSRKATWDLQGLKIEADLAKLANEELELYILATTLGVLCYWPAAVIAFYDLALYALNQGKSVHAAYYMLEAARWEIKWGGGPMLLDMEAQMIAYRVLNKGIPDWMLHPNLIRKG